MGRIILVSICGFWLLFGACYLIDQTAWSKEHPVLFGIGILAIGVAFISLLTGWILAPVTRLERLKGSGLQGEASILSAPDSEAGAANVMGEVALQVRLQGREPYVARTPAIIPASKHAALLGSTVPVWVDPKDPEQVYIDMDAVPSEDDLIQRRHQELLKAQDEGPAAPDEK